MTEKLKLKISYSKSELFFLVSSYDLKHISLSNHKSIWLSLMLLHSKCLRIFCPCSNSSRSKYVGVLLNNFIIGRHVFKIKSPVYVCFESRCVNFSNTLKENTVGAKYYLAGNDRAGEWGCLVTAQSSCSLNLILLRNAVHLIIY